MIFRPEQLQNCNACGFCQAACPVYRITRHEGSSARGHHAHLKALLADGVRSDRRMASHFAECLTCRACTANCPPGIQTDRVVVEGRSRLLAQRSPRLERFLLRCLLTDSRRLRRWMQLLRFGSGAPANLMLSLLHKLALLPTGLRRACDMLPRPKGGFLYERLGRPPQPAGKEGISYFLSCGMNYLQPDAGEASLRVLRALGGEVRIAENLCCGLPAYVVGEIEIARRIASQNLAVFSEHKGPIVSDCASCSSFLKQYPALLGEEALEFSTRVRDFTEFVAEQERPKSSLAPRIVTYHDPCHLSRYQAACGGRAQPRRLLKEIEGVEYRELPEADWCCGGAGTYALRHPRLSLQILERKMNNLRLTGADTLATACPGCLLQLQYGVRKWKLPVQVLHISQILAQTLDERNSE